jgi:hypothetical protein
MKMNLKRIAGAATLAATLVGGGIVAAAPANAACKASTFCAFDGRSEGGDLLVSSTYTGNGTVDVADNRVASARNNTTRHLRPEPQQRQDGLLLGRHRGWLHHLIYPSPPPRALTALGQSGHIPLIKRGSEDAETCSSAGGDILDALYALGVFVDRRSVRVR